MPAGNHGSCTCHLELDVCFTMIPCRRVSQRGLAITTTVSHRQDWPLQQLCLKDRIGHYNNCVSQTGLAITTTVSHREDWPLQ